MRELTKLDAQQISGGEIAGDIGRWFGEQVGYLQNTIKEYVYNEPFREQYS